MTSISHCHCYLLLTTAFSNVRVPIKILLVMPATNASSERSFSGVAKNKDLPQNHNDTEVVK